MSETRVILGLMLLGILGLVGATPIAALAQDSPVIRPEDDPRNPGVDDPSEVLPGGSARIPRHTVWFLGATDFDDLFLGGGYHLAILPHHHLGIGIYYQTRTAAKTVLHTLRPHFHLQVEETRRDLAYLMLEKAVYWDPRFGVYGGFGYGYSGGNYRGTSATAPFGWTPVIEAGFALQLVETLPGFRARLGYQYADRISSDQDMILFRAGVTF